MPSLRTHPLRRLTLAAGLVGLLVAGLQPLATAASPSLALVNTAAGSIAAGEGHTCAVKSDGTVWCWGGASDGEVGDGTRGDINFRRLTPVQVVDGGGGFLTGVKAVTANWYTTCALKTDGTVWCWGEGQLGQLGNNTGGGDGGPQSLVPVQVVHGGGFLTGVAAISGGSRHNCALKTDGTVWCWGYDGFGQLGDGTLGTGNYQTRLTPVQVVLGTGKMTGVIAIAAGGASTCAIRSGGTVWCWGDDYYGELGDGTRGGANHLRPKPVQVVQGTGKLASATAIAAGSGHTCVRKSIGTVWCWGWDWAGQIGDGTRGNTSHLRLKPIQVVYGTGKLTGIAKITANNQHTCAVKTTGTVWCWGYDYWGQLGDGTRGNTIHMRLKPVQVVYGTGKLTGVARIAAGGEDTCAVKSVGTMWCWGLDSTGQLGDHTLGASAHLRLKPVQVLFP